MALTVPVSRVGVGVGVAGERVPVPVDEAADGSTAEPSDPSSKDTSVGPPDAMPIAAATSAATTVSPAVRVVAARRRATATTLTTVALIIAVATRRRRLRLAPEAALIRAAYR